MQWFEAVGEKFRRERAIRDQSLEFAAQGIGIAPRTLQRIERGKVPRVRGETLWQIATYYRLEVKIGGENLMTCRLDNEC